MREAPYLCNLFGASQAYPAASRPAWVAVEIKRHAGISAVEQLDRYMECLRPEFAHRGGVRGVLAAQSIDPQARTLATMRDIECLVVDYDELRGIDRSHERLF